MNKTLTLILFGIGVLVGSVVPLAFFLPRTTDYIDPPTTSGDPEPDAEINGTYRINSNCNFLLGEINENQYARIFTNQQTILLEVINPDDEGILHAEGWISGQSAYMHGIYWSSTQSENSTELIFNLDFSYLGRLYGEVVDSSVGRSCYIEFNQVLD